MNDIKRGDIFYVTQMGNEVGSEQQSGRPAIIVSNNMNNDYSPTCEIVYLTTQPKNDLPTHCLIRTAYLKPSTALCEQITTVSVTRLGDYICTLSEADMIPVDACLMVSLGLGSPEKKEKEKATIKVKPEDLPIIPDPYTATEKLKADLANAQAKAEIYEKLYHDLLERALNKA